MTTRSFDSPDSALEALGADASAVCAARLARVTGTHALLLDGTTLPAPVAAGVACWTWLSPCRGSAGWEGALRADAQILPFGNESFCAVMMRFAGGAYAAPEPLAAELARVLAPHGVLLIVDQHPRSLWHAGMPPGPWERALRREGLATAPAIRCGAPWPREHGAAGMPHWLVRGMGGAWLIEAHRHNAAAIPLRRQAPGRRTVEHATLAPGARRQCA